MGAPKRIPDAVVVEVIQAWSGNLTGAAAQLGMAKENLRKRLHALGVNLEAVRLFSKGSAKSAATLGGHRYPSASPLPIAAVHHAATKIEAHPNAIYPGNPEIANVPGVRNEMSPAEPPDVDAMPVKPMPRRELPLRLRPDLKDRLQKAVFEFQATFGYETSVNMVLEQFVEENFEGWKAAKLSKRGGGRPKGKE